MRRLLVIFFMLGSFSATSLGAGAQGAASAKAFVTELYSNYMNGGVGVHQTARYFHSSLQSCSTRTSV